LSAKSQSARRLCQPICMPGFSIREGGKKRSISQPSFTAKHRSCAWCGW
jgi:hypothetical protein